MAHSLAASARSLSACYLSFCVSSPPGPRRPRQRGNPPHSRVQYRLVDALLDGALHISLSIPISQLSISSLDALRTQFCQVLHGGLSFSLGRTKLCTSSTRFSSRFCTCNSRERVMYPTCLRNLRSRYATKFYE
jgi:hypothetical protein